MCACVYISVFDYEVSDKDHHWNRCLASVCKASHGFH